MLCTLVHAGHRAYVPHAVLYVPYRSCVMFL